MQGHTAKKWWSQSLIPVKGPLHVLPYNKDALVSTKKCKIISGWAVGTDFHEEVIFGLRF